MAEQAVDRPVCGERADTRGFFRCQKNADHHGDRHHTRIPGGDYTWGYTPTADEIEAKDNRRG
ncbi:hypothetical protein GCM10011608_10460 [Micromonospora sonchi]|uniref:Uncharacterized protein n=1 Tax=Micromonospora sonchi TaxID=1763543 RepID=A0A917TLH2_9ACTN|nr:hypothetical protein [Micromonospora sonchi]GGM27557.1 hypothetical protein GCM10011608_10460 [Micromonospora sonchi]